MSCRLRLGFLSADLAFGRSPAHSGKEVLEDRLAYRREGP